LIISSISPPTLKRNPQDRRYRVTKVQLTEKNIIYKRDFDGILTNEDLTIFFKFFNTLKWIMENRMRNDDVAKI
jgi:hypothetical protein